MVGEDISNAFDVANELRECFTLASFLFFLFPAMSSGSKKLELK